MHILIKDIIVRKMILEIAEQENIIDLDEYLKQEPTVPYEKLYTPTEIGNLLDKHMSARKVNELLEYCGFQYKDEKKHWNPTEKAYKFLMLTTAIKSNKDDKIIISLDFKWRYPIIDVLNSIIKEGKEVA